MDRFLESRDRLLASAAPGRPAARELSEMTDAAVRDLSRAAAASLTGRWAVLALGGWGAGLLYPGSDLDLLVLCESSSRSLVDGVLYPLWDSGLAIGHQVRTPRQQLAAMRADVQTCTAALTARPIAGDIAWAENQLAGWLRDRRRRARSVLRELAARPRGGSPYLLTPDLKDGRGGKRDYDELVWTAALLSGRVQDTPAHLVELGLLTAEEFASLEDAAETSGAARWTTHLAGERDLLADALAGAPARATEDVHHALGTTAALLDRVRARLSGTAAKQSTWTGGQVLRALDDGPDGVLALEEAALEGLLDHLVPDFGRLLLTRWGGIGHEYTVGAHCLRAAALVAVAGDGGLLGASRRAADRELVQVAALTHDVGKLERGPDHGRRGAATARVSALAFGLDEVRADGVARLVEHHLLLPETALKADLDDEDTVLRCADLIGDRSLLSDLHVLTAVDSLATGTSTWTPWVSTVIDTLVSRLDAVLGEDSSESTLATRGEAVRLKALEALGAGSGAARSFLNAASLRYLASRSPETAASDAALASSLPPVGASDPFLTAVTQGAADDTHVITLAAHDQPGLLSAVTGAMTLCGLDVLSLDAYVMHDGVALDVFTVASSTRAAITPETFARLDRTISVSLKDPLGLSVRLEQYRSHYPARSGQPVSVEVRRSGWSSVLHVTAADRPGLLWKVACAVRAAGVDIQWARVRTVDGVADDAFCIVGADGGPVDEPGALGHVAMALRDSL